MSNPLNLDFQFEQGFYCSNLVDAQTAYLQQNNLLPNPRDFILPETAAEHRPLGGTLEAAQPSAVHQTTLAWDDSPNSISGDSPNEDGLVFHPLYLNDFGGCGSSTLEMDDGFWSVGSEAQTLVDGNSHGRLQNDDTATAEYPQVAEETNSSGVSSTERRGRGVGSPRTSKLSIKCPEPDCPKYYTTKAGLDYHKRVSTESNVVYFVKY